MLTTRTPHKLSIWLKLGCFALALMVSVPFLITRHFQPLPSFSSEWWAAVLGLAAFALVFSERQNVVTVPRMVFLPLLFIPVILLQWMTGRVYISSAAIIAIEYLLWASCLVCLGGHLKARVGLSRIVVALAWGLLIGGLAGACATVVQLLRLPMSPFVVFTPELGRPYGNLGQANHLAAQLWFAVIAAIYLSRSRRLSPLVFALSIVALMTAAAASQSRSPLIYAGLTALLVALNGQSLRLAVMLPLMQVSLALSVPHLAKAFTTGANTVATGASTFQRLSNVPVDVRSGLWADAWRMFLDHPWLGIGRGNYSRASVEYSAAKTSGIPLPAEHAHNLPLQLLAEFGLPTTLLALVMVGALLRWTLPLLRNKDRPDIFFTFAVLGILSAYSMLEYPLWYTYFLGICALLIGAIDPRVKPLVLENRKTLLAGVIVVGAVFLGPLRYEEQKMERALLWHYRGHSLSAAFSEAVATIEGISRKSLLAPYAELVLATAIVPNSAVAAQHWEVCRSVLKFAPTAPVLEKCAVSARFLGQSAVAEAMESQKKAAWGK